MSLILPKEKHIPKADNAKFLILYGKPKSGKTSFVASIPNNLIIDLESGADYIEAMSVKAKSVSDLAEIANAIKAEIETTGKMPYDYITIDSGTVLEDIAKDYALKLYQQTPMAKDKLTGKIYNDSVLKLPKGAGYAYLREAFEKLWRTFLDLTPHLIMICHCKDSLVDVDGAELTEKSIDLSGKISRIVSQKADAIGLVYRKENKTIAAFGKDSTNTISGARPKHLRNTEIIIGESDESQDVIFYPERIYLPE